MTFVMDTPTTRLTDWVVQGPQSASDYTRFVITAYPDLVWEVIAPPMFRTDVRKPRSAGEAAATFPEYFCRPASRAPAMRSRSKDSRYSPSAVSRRVTSTRSMT